MTLSILPFLPLLPVLSGLLIGLLWRTGHRNDALFSGLSIMASALTLLLLILFFGKATSWLGGFMNDLPTALAGGLALLAGIVARAFAYSRKHPGLLILMDLSSASALAFFLSHSFLGWAIFGFLLSLFSLLIIFSPVLEGRFQRSCMLLGTSDLALLLAAGASLFNGQTAMGPVSPAILTLLLLAAILKVAVFANPSELDESRQPPLPTFIHFAFPPLAGAYLLVRLGTPGETAMPWLIGLALILLLMAILFANIEGFSQVFIEGGGIRLGRFFDAISRQGIDALFSGLALLSLAGGEAAQATEGKKLADYLLVFAVVVTVLVSLMAFYLQRWL